MASAVDSLHTSALAPLSACSALVMSFEERLPDEEQAFMVRLGLGRREDANDAGNGEEEEVLLPPLHVEELLGDAVTVDFEDSLQRKGAGGAWVPLSLSWSTTATPGRPFVIDGTPASPSWLDSRVVVITNQTAATIRLAVARSFSASSACGLTSSSTGLPMA